MPITNGNELDNGAPAAVATVDSAAIAGAVVQGLQRAGLFNQPQPGQSQSPVSKFEQKFNEFSKNEENDQATLNGIKELLQAHGEDIENKMSAKQQQELKQALLAQLNNSTIRLIESSVSDYLKDDDLLVEYKDILKDKVIKTFNEDPKYEAARIRYGNGDVDVDLLKKIALEEINKFNKGRGKGQQAKGPTGMKQSDGIAEASAAAGTREAGDTVDVSELDSKEMALYNARLGTAQRLGYRRDSKEAKELASDAVLSLRQGEAKAKAKGYRPLNRR